MSNLNNKLPLSGQSILITGAARRLGRSMALAAAKAGANVLIHFNNSSQDAEDLANQIQAIGQQAWLLQEDISDENNLALLCENAFAITQVSALINNASIFHPESFLNTSEASWREHIQVNLTTPFQLSQAFARNVGKVTTGTIINMLDWRALRPGSDHFAYTISKSALAAMTQSLALSLAPNVSVNAIALGAILPPENEQVDASLLDKVPLRRWAKLSELNSLLIYLLKRPLSLTGQVIHLDGGRHLVK